MSRNYQINDHGNEGYTLDLIVNDETIATLPYRSLIDAHEFGSEFVAQDSERQAAMARHPAGKRRLAEV